MTAAVSLKCPWVPGFCSFGGAAPWVAMSRGRRERGSARKQRVLKAGPRCERLNGYTWFAEYLVIRQISPRSVIWVSVTLAVQMRWDFHQPPLNEFSNDRRQKSFFPPEALQLTLKTKQKLPFSNLAHFIFHCGIDVCPVNLEEVSVPWGGSNYWRIGCLFSFCQYQRELLMALLTMACVCYWVVVNKLFKKRLRVEWERSGKLWLLLKTVDSVIWQLLPHWILKFTLF